MFLRIKLITLNIASASMLFFFLCLGSQNLSKRHNINFLVNKTVPLPIGFVVGSSFCLGLLSGGLTSVLMIKKTNNDGN